MALEGMFLLESITKVCFHRESIEVFNEFISFPSYIFSFDQSSLVS